jgi:5-oxoprolinase (ATP-hydrolysing)/N-methylhydantoinase B
MIFDNVRTETMNRGDLDAMLGAGRLGRERFLRLLDRYGPDVVMSAAYEWMDYSERMLRREIERLPDGVYRAPTGWLDDDGVNRGLPLRVETAVEVAGDEITVDLTGSHPEVPTGFNVPFEGSLLVSCYYAVRTVLLDEVTSPERVPQNDGVFRPVRVVAPRGTIFNPSFPRACFSRFCQVQRVVDNVVLALGQARPEQALAGSSAAMTAAVYSGFVAERAEYWVHIEINEGCYGGRNGKDAMDSVDCHLANTRNNPIEECELRFPLQCDRYELRPEPAAPGRWRGGVGIVRRTRYTGDGDLACEAARHIDPPRGAAGGWDGLCGWMTKNPDLASAAPVPAVVTGVHFAPGEVLEIVVPSGGGYGDPLDRPAETVREDVLDGFTTVDLAREAYGVVFADERTLAIDHAATERLRAELRAAPRTTSLTDWLARR